MGRPGTGGSRRARPGGVSRRRGRGRPTSGGWAMSSGASAPSGVSAKVSATRPARLARSARIGPSLTRRTDLADQPAGDPAVELVEVVPRRCWVSSSRRSITRIASPARIEASRRDRSRSTTACRASARSARSRAASGPGRSRTIAPTSRSASRPALARDRPAGLVEVLVSRGGLARSREIFQGQRDPAEGRHGLPLDQVHGAGGRLGLVGDGLDQPARGRQELAGDPVPSPNPAR